jgi:Rrf2 family protein
LVIFYTFVKKKSVFKKETEYALRGLVYIQMQNQIGKRPGILEIASEIDTPPSFTAKILQRLVRIGFIESAKGKNGGYYFDSDKKELSLKSIIVAIEGEKIFTGCGFGLKHCDENNPCPLHDAYAPIRDALNQLLSTETIQNLAKKDNPERALSRLNGD